MRPCAGPALQFLLLRHLPPPVGGTGEIRRPAQSLAPLFPIPLVDRPRLAPLDVEVKSGAKNFGVFSEVMKLLDAGFARGVHGYGGVNMPSVIRRGYLIRMVAETVLVTLGAVGSLASIAGWLDARRAAKDAAASKKASRDPRGVPKLPDRRPFVTNAPRDLDRPTVGRREELAQLDDFLLAPAGAAAITPAVSMTAHGGMGKTTLALTYGALQRHRTRFEGVWLVRAEDEQTLLSDIEMLGLELGQTRPQDVKPQDWAQNVWRQVAKSPYPWLILFDNAPDFVAVRAHLPSGPTFRLIVTSREQDWPGNRFHPLGVDPLPIPEAAELLEHEAERNDDRAGAEALAEALDGFPLALVLAGAYARDAQLSFAECEERIADLMARRAPSDYPHKLGAVLDLTLARIEADDDTGPDELALLDLLPWLAPEGMDARLVLDVARSTQPKDAISGPTLALATDSTRLHLALSALDRRSLVHVEGQGPARTVALHRITAEILRYRATPHATEQQAAAAAVVATSYPFDVGDHKNWAECRRLDAHARALVSVIDAHQLDGLPFQSMEVLLYLNSRASAYHLENLSWKMALAFADAALKIFLAISMSNHRLEGTLRVHISVALLRLGEIESALREHRKAIDVLIRVPNEDLELASQFSSFSVTLADWSLTRTEGSEDRADSIQEAIWYATRGCEIGAADPKCDPISRAHLLNNLGYVYAAGGDWLRSMRPKKRTISALKSMQSPNFVRIASAQNNIGAGYVVLGNSYDALLHLTESLMLRERLYAEEGLHPHRVMTAEWLVACVLNLDPPDCERAREICDTYDLSFDDIASKAAQYRPPPPSAPPLP
jgi:tetratricopeptide (TPR) repeat protein